MRNRLRPLAFAALALAAGLLGSLLREPVSAIAQNVACYMDQGGALWHAGSGCTWQVESGGAINIAAGGALKWGGTTIRVARGQQTTASASDTVVTGLTTVVAVVCSFETDVADANSWVTCQVGNQAGAPAAGSIIVKTWQNTTGTDPTPVAAASFAKLVNWIAIGT